MGTNLSEVTKGFISGCVLTWIAILIPIVLGRVFGDRE